jgi:TfoX/Sxy family transcriptional regulator of competence genes
MAYDEDLAHRVSKILAQTPNLVEKKMFGGIGYLVNGNMACGVLGESLIVRVGPDRYQETLSQPHTAVFDMTGRPMTGWVVVNPLAFGSEGALESWVGVGLAFVATLPPK